MHQDEDEKNLSASRIFGARRKNLVALARYNSLGPGNDIDAAVGIFNGPMIHVLKSGLIRVYGRKKVLCWEGLDPDLAEKIRVLDTKLRDNVSFKTPERDASADVSEDELADEIFEQDSEILFD